MWLPNIEGRRGPVYRAIADAIDRDVQNGSLTQNRVKSASWRRRPFGSRSTPSVRKRPKPSVTRS